MPRISRHAITIGYLLALAVLAVDGVLVATSLRTIAHTSEQANRSRDFIAELDRSLSMLKDAETGQRGYLLTGRGEYLRPYRDAGAALDGKLGGLRSLTSGGAQQARVADLAGIAAGKMAELEQTVRLRQQGDRDEALRIVQGGQGLGLMDRARETAAAIRAEEGRTLDLRTLASQAAVRRTFATFALTTGTALLLLVGVFSLQRRDASARERAAAAIRSSEAWLSTTLTSIGDAVIATDGEGRVTFLNPVARSLTGWSQEDAKGRPMQEVFPIINETTRRAVEDPVAKVIREGVIVGLANHTLLIARDGTETPIDDSAAPIKDERGAVAGVVLVFRDITERKREEARAEEQRRLALFGRDVGLALTECPDLGSMLGRCVEETVRHLDGAFARIWTVDEAGEVLELRASAGMYTHLDGPHSRVPVGAYKIGTIARERTPHLTNSVIGDPLVPAQEWAEREGMVAFAGYPLVVEDRLVGVWAMFARHELSESALEAMESVANGIALGIDRRRAQERLDRQREWLQVTLASIGDAVVATDARGRVTFLNPVARSLTGWPEEEAGGRPIEEVFRIVHEQTREPADPPVGTVIREGVVVGLSNHTLLIARDGTETPIEDSAAPIRDAEGDIIGVVVVFRDVTEERAAREVVREAGDRLRFTLDATEVGQWDLDLMTGQAVRSPRHDQIFGYDSPPEVWSFDTLLDKHVPPDRRAELERSFREATRGAGREWEFECPIVRTDGAERWIWSKAAIYSDDGARPTRMLGLIMDVTERKRAAEELRVAKEEAEHASRAKDQFLAVLSHELRTPLNPILLAVTSMLERPTAAEDVRPNLEMIRHSVNLQSRLIDDLLDVMRIVRGKMPLHWEVVDSHVLVAHAVQICRSEVFGKGLGLTVELAAERHHINADPVRLQQVFWNLIKNAVKFTASGGSIAIRTRSEPDREAQGDRLLIEVIDTGIGIEPEILGRIFDPFQQGETSITRRYGGLGLGLAISKGIVEGHGGALTAESEGKDRGTTFRIELKALPEPRLEEDGRLADGASRAEPPSPSPLKVLLVEDEQATRRLMARLLKGLGHEVATAGTIAEALEEEERSGGFGLIVSDIGLPDGSGLDLMRRVVARRGPIPAIALTGYGMEEDIQRSREAGFTAHMTKPIDFAKLEAMIRQVAS